MASSQTKRRRFQPPITSFFPASDVTTAPAAQIANSPSIPHALQSSLLTVGMRIRKSVPEGYKTTPKSSIFMDARPVANTSSRPAAIDARSGYGCNNTGFAELAPYCGILKTGGLAVQSFPSVPGDDPWESFPSSQESFASDFSTESAPATNVHKRSLDLESDDEDEENMASSITTGAPLSSISANGSRTTNFRSHSYRISHTKMPDLNMLAKDNPTTGRLFAQPKSRNKAKMGTAGMQQTRLAVNEGNVVMMEEDFDEAPFLQRKEDLEVEMGGI